MPAAIQNSHVLAGDPLRTDDIRWAQVELRFRGLYQGSLDGILGPGTKRALSQFQQIKGLGPTASLNAQTWQALTGNPPIVEGSRGLRPHGI
jgi:peptidoglycan hydrolase-like protein with peptidoglycan-binding domain